MYRDDLSTGYFELTPNGYNGLRIYDLAKGIIRPPMDYIAIRIITGEDRINELVIDDVNPYAQFIVETVENGVVGSHIFFSLNDPRGYWYYTGYKEASNA